MFDRSGFDRVRPLWLAHLRADGLYYGLLEAAGAGGTVPARQNSVACPSGLRERIANPRFMGSNPIATFRF